MRSGLPSDTGIVHVRDDQELDRGLQVTVRLAGEGVRSENFQDRHLGQPLARG